MTVIVNVEPRGDGGNDNDYAVVVTNAGNVSRASDGGITAKKDAAGIYSVTFPKEVDNGVWIATIGDPKTPPAALAPGFITTELANNAPRVVIVRTFAANAVAVERDFHLYVRRF